MGKLSTAWYSVRSTYWFLPSLMVMGVLALHVLATAIDERVDTGDLDWLYTGGADGAREILSAVATSMITVAGVVFSITIVALTLASSQFGPRILRSFMRDTGNQIVLGTFIATFLYCLLVLRRIRGEESGEVVPAVSVTLGIVLAVAGVAVLIYFIHHVASSLQAERVVGRVAQELEGAIDRMFPEQVGMDLAEVSRAADPEPEFLEEVNKSGATVHCDRTGYLQAIVGDRLVEVAKEADGVLTLDCRPGDFLVRDDRLAKIWPAARGDDDLAGRVRGAFIVGMERTMAQDVDFGFGQLTEIALRALSPGVNIPSLAAICVDYMAASLSMVAGRKFPSAYRYDADGQLRVISPLVSFDDLVDISLAPVRRNARGDVSILMRLLHALEAIGGHAVRQEQTAALIKEARLVAQAVDVPEPEHERLQEEAARVMTSLRRRDSGSEVEAIEGSGRRRAASASA